MSLENDLLPITRLVGLGHIDKNILTLRDYMHRNNTGCQFCQILISRSLNSVMLDKFDHKGSHAT